MSNVAPILPATIGHNSGDITDIQVLQENLKSKYERAVNSSIALCSEANATAREITNEDEASRVTDLIKSILSQDKAMNTYRESEKEPFNKGGRAVDGFFNPWRDKLGQAKSTLSGSLTIWQRLKADQERKKRDQAAAEARAAAEAKAAEALAIENAGVKDVANEQLGHAVALEAQANKATLAAIARPSDLTKARGVSGSVASLRSTWVGELLNRDGLDLEQLRAHLPEAALVQAIGSFVRAGGRELRGAKIWEKTESVVR